MYQTRYPGYDGGVPQTSFFQDETGQMAKTQGVFTNRPVRNVNFVNDANFQPFGDPDQPIMVRAQRLGQMLSGGKSELEVEQYRQFARVHQQFQPQLLNPYKPGDIDQLGPKLHTLPNYHEGSELNQSEVVAENGSSMTDKLIFDFTGPQALPTGNERTETPEQFAIRAQEIQQKDKEADAKRREELQKEEQVRLEEEKKEAAEKQQQIEEMQKKAKRAGEKSNYYLKGTHSTTSRPIDRKTFDFSRIYSLSKPSTSIQTVEQNKTMFETF